MSMTKKKANGSASKPARWRLPVQLLSLVVWVNPFLVRWHTVCSPVFHCYSCPLATFACPIGVIANFAAIHTLPFLAVGTMVLAGTLLGTFVCGWMCPFGFLQDLLDRVPTPKFRLPAWTGYARYAVLLGLVLAVPYWWGEGHALFFCRLCPAGALEAALPVTVQTAMAGQQIAWPSTAKIAILAGVLIAALFTWRPWCNLLCPLGAIYALSNRASLLVLRFHPSRCVGCADCRSLCHTGTAASTQCNELQCVRCLECTRCRAVTIETVFHKSGPQEPPASAV